MKPAAIIAVLAFALTAPSTALGRVYLGTVRYARPHAALTPGAGSAFTSEAPYLTYVSAAYNSRAGALVVKYAFYQPSLWNMRHMPNPPEVLLAPTCPRAEGLESLAEPHEFLLEVGQATSAGGGSAPRLGLAHLAGFAREIQGGSPLSFSGTYYRVAVASSHFRARNWRCLTVDPAAQSSPAGSYSLELDAPVSIKMSAAGKARATQPRPHEAKVLRAQRELREEREEERATEHLEQRERREEHTELRAEERKARGAETGSEKEEREEREEERREEEEERREEEQERREECEEQHKPRCQV